MKLLLVFLLCTVIIGLVSDRLDGRVYASVGALATMLLAVFFVFERFWM